MDIYIQLTSIGPSAGPFNLYSNVTIPPYAAAFAVGVSSATLLAGDTFTVPDGTSIVRIKSMNPTCPNEIFLNVSPGALVVSNSTTDDDILDIQPGTFYSLPTTFPITPDNTVYGEHYGITGAINVQVSGNNVGRVRLFVNSMYESCIDVLGTGTQVLIFSSLTLSPSDIVEIFYQDGSC